MPSVWYSSDHHFGHKNILGYEQRPYADIEEMDESLIQEWNRVVHKEDTVYYLGDLCLGGVTKWESILPRLDGKIHLILGNHDDRKVVNKVAHHFESVQLMKERVINKTHLFLFHYPIDIGFTPNAISVHGHIHSRASRMANQINVGVDSPWVKDSLGFGRMVPEELLLDSLAARKETIMTMRSFQSQCREEE